MTISRTQVEGVSGLIEVVARAICESRMTRGPYKPRADKLAK